MLVFDLQVVGWKNWMAGREQFEVAPDAKFSDIIVPTLDTVRSAYLLEILLTNNKKVGLLIQ